MIKLFGLIFFISGIVAYVSGNFEIAIFLLLVSIYLEI